MSTDVYLKRIMHTLEHVIAPEIESDAARGQVFAVINLLDNLGKKIEYKQDLVKLDVEAGTGVMKKIVVGLEGAAEPPEELTKLLSEIESGAAGKGLSLRAGVEEAVSKALDFFHANRGKLEDAKARELDAMIRDYLVKISTRDLGLMAAPNFDKISRSKRGGK